LCSQQFDQAIIDPRRLDPEADQPADAVGRADRCPALGRITLTQADEQVTRKLNRPGAIQWSLPLKWPVPLARLAVDMDYQRRGLGFSLLQDAIMRTVSISDQAGIRALLTHPIDAEADAFYRCFGFESTPTHDRQLILLLKDGISGSADIGQWVTGLSNVKVEPISSDRPEWIRGKWPVQKFPAECACSALPLCRNEWGLEIEVMKEIAVKKW
jgi:GNAT superfamily N-acetyltransferase